MSTEIIVRASIDDDPNGPVKAATTIMNTNPNLDMVTVELTQPNGQVIKILLTRAEMERSGAYGNFLERVQDHIRQPQEARP